MEEVWGRNHMHGGGVGENHMHEGGVGENHMHHGGGVVMNRMSGVCGKCGRGEEYNHV